MTEFERGNSENGGRGYSSFVQRFACKQKGLCTRGVIDAAIRRGSAPIPVSTLGAYRTLLIRMRRPLKEELPP